MTRTIRDQVIEKEIELKARMIVPKYLIVGIWIWPRLVMEAETEAVTGGQHLPERYRGMLVLIHPSDRYIVDVVGCPET